MSDVRVDPRGGVMNGDRWLPDDIADDDYVSSRTRWGCRRCRSTVLHYTLHGQSRVRLLHADETCPCFGRRCGCQKPPAGTEVPR